jgi:glycosyltransferase involved in cell wall biosynthesis
MTTRRIVFWEPTVSPHKSSLIAALADIAGDALELVVCAGQGLLPERARLGWSQPTGHGPEPTIAPTHAQIEALVGSFPADTLHLVSGIRHVPMIVAALASIRRHGARFALMSEPRASEGWAGVLRYAQSWLTEGWLRRNVEFVLTIGRHGPAWFRRVGYPQECLFPFAYFVAPSTVESACAESATIRVAYVGRLVTEKGVADIVEAVANLGTSARLTMVGDGPERDKLVARCRTLNLVAEFPGVLPMPEVAPLLAAQDILVLASTASNDGWGVVVNEALLAGTAVVASERAGASIMLDDARLGRVVPPGSPPAIATAIQALQTSGAFAEPARELRRQVALARLAPEVGARHLLAIVRWRDGAGNRPPPFYAAAISTAAA